MFKQTVTRCWISVLTIPLFMAGCDGGTAGEDPNLGGGQGASGGSAGAGRSGISGNTGTSGDGNAGGRSSGGSQNSGGSESSGGSKSSGGAAGSTGLGGAGGGSPTGGHSADGGRAGSSPGGAAGRGATGGHSGGQGGTAAAGAAGASIGGASATGGTNGSGEYGFSYRRPGSQKFSCNSEVDVPDADWLCTFHVGDRLAYVYAQATGVGVTCLLASFGVYEVKLAQISLDGAVSSLTDAAYDWGGGHHNDSLSFSYGGKIYKYYHSSFGFGFRSCQPMDCLNVYAPGATAPETEGCGAQRTVPEVCVPIQANGSHDPLIDKFMKCPGDTT